MHKQRVLTGLILGSVVLAGLLWGGRPFFNSLAFAVSFFCLYEYFSMTFEKSPAFQVAGIALGLVPVLFSMFHPGNWNILLGIFLIFVAGIIMFLFSYGRHENPFTEMAVFVFGATYIGLCASLIVLIHAMPCGNLWIIFLLAVVAAADTGAFYVGSIIGRRKLCPSISKGKTVEGAAGGLAASALTALICWLIFMRSSDPTLLAAAAVLLGLASQAGDLTESIIKRAFNRKDSGRMLPGHGGVFDRVDGLLLAGPVLFWILYFSKGHCSLG
ncbi:MAG: hypothetical protein DSZ23_02255 [Thermodesulfatator sp.]|nr:MAG: hypothetical protein DSZ23_02255 [Thermodesulfatator sp.]